MKVDAREFLTALSKLNPNEREELIKKACSQENEEAFMKTLESRLSKSGWGAGIRGGLTGGLGSGDA